MEQGTKELKKDFSADEQPLWIVDSGNRQRIDRQELYLHIKENGHILVVKRGNEKRVVLYQYRDNHYKLLTESDCKAYIKSFLPVKIRKPADWEVPYKELITDYANISENDLNSNEDIINFKNGILNIKTNELLPHNPKYLCTIQIPCDWKPDLSLEDAPIFKDFLNTITSGNVDDQKTLLEVIGLCISNVDCSLFKKLLILKGVGNTGKTVFRQFVINTIGEKNSHSLDIKQLSERFAISELYGIRLAGYGDMSFADVKAMDKIKELTGGDSTRAEAKYQNGYQFKYKGFLMYCCNELPHFAPGQDRGEWVYGRFLIVSCNNPIPQERQDKHLLEKLYNEREAVVSVAIRYLQKAIERGNLTESEQTLQNRKNYEIRNNSFALFLKEKCLLHTGRTNRSFFNNIYIEWCRENNLRPEPMSERKAMLEKLGISAMKSGEYYYNLTIH
ncbi:hypothetical protein H8693_09760 [Christensenellaceae bacterium NSJ-63]|uniref:SF3 helicase domain-containing protein n=1 Tax=Guopingia tenuis TaxID=2763656 RepID=A0A926DK50_9FIRM|nr:phage/plasmid primase, P4 family [Guopingia tenuis]MBC8539212.1 hypothetical protein [Guopingia tenuis]